MKLSSLSAILLLSALTAAAEVVMVSGTVYDVGKGSYSTDSQATNRNDSDLCWAAAASNLIQHWQDAYGVAEGAPNGTQTGYTQPSGTQYLTIYDLFRNNFTNGGGCLEMAVNWYFNGNTPNDGLNFASDAGLAELVEDAAEAGFYKEKGIRCTTTTMISPSNLKEALATPFQNMGYAVFLSISHVDGTGGHAITCWGYETDENQNICALYITDSDDRKFGAQRLEVNKDGENVLLSSAYGNSHYSSETYKLAGISYLTTTGSTYNTTQSANTIESLPSEICTALDISGLKFSSYNLVVKDGGILAASGKGGTKLTINGGNENEGYTEGIGLTVLPGAMVSLSQAEVSISGFKGNGMSVGSEVHIAKGNVSVQNNFGIGIAVQGNADDPKAYMGMSGNSSVVVANNKYSGLLVGDGVLIGSSGGYYPAGSQLDITVNESVVISNNYYNNNTTLGNGGAALVNGVLNLTGNGKLSITNNTAYNGAAIYATSTATAANSGYCITDAAVSIDGNKEVYITGNTAKNLDIVYFLGTRMSISGNNAVDISNNVVTAKSASQAVLHNAGKNLTVTNGVVQMKNPSIMEIAHNGSVTFSGNDAKYDIYNEGALYLCADKGQSVTFQHGFANSSDGTTTIGKDASGNTSTGGTYIFKGDGKAVVLETTTATISAGGSIAWATSDCLSVSRAEIADATFTLYDCNLTLADVVCSGAISVDCGYFGETNKLTLSNAVDTLAITIHLDSVAEMATFGSSELTETTVTIDLSDYITLGNGVELTSGVTFTLDGTLADGQSLVVDTSGLSISDSNVIATAYTMDRNESGTLYYSAKSTEYTPEPTTTTLSLLALAALAARRRRRFALPTNH